MIQARIKKRIHGEPQSAGFTLEVEFQTSEGITVIFGPTGSGKTMLLDMIAGFVKPDEGRLLLNDEILFDGAAGVNVPPQKRRCGYLFQNNALFPHMTLRENLVFAASCLPKGRRPKLERHRRVNELLERFRLTEISGRRPSEVSGGERQRCAIARALIAEPRLLLLDEPSQGLDAALRLDLYGMLRQVRSESGVPVLVVTHNLDECLEIGEQMLVLHDGQLRQNGSPREILDRPANLVVARLLGGHNLIPAEIASLDPANRTSRLRLGKQELAGPYFPGRLRGDRVWICVRPEELRVTPREGGAPGSNQLAAKLVRVTERRQNLRLEFTDQIFADVARGDFEQKARSEEWLIEFPADVLRVL